MNSPEFYMGVWMARGYLGLERWELCERMHQLTIERWTGRYGWS